MLSGEHSSVPIDFIWVDRAKRVRRVLTEEAIAEKMESISRHGLIHDPVITREGELVAGETRWTACARLGWTSITVKWVDDCDADELLEIELEENIKRTDLPWQDQCDALLRLHTRRVAADPQWTQAQTAERIGLKANTVAEQLAVALKLASGDAMVSAAPKYSVAKGLTVRQNARASQDELSAIKAPGGTPQPEPETPIVCADFNEWAPVYEGPPFNFLHCDFPYGIDAHTFHQSAGDQFGTYDDTFETYEQLLSTLFTHREKLLGESAHLIFWFSMKHYQWTLEKLRANFWVDSYPLVWVKSDNKGTLPDPTRGPRRIYEVAFLCSHGDRPILKAVSNTFAGPTVRDGEHMSEKSADMLAHFMRMTVEDNTRMLDPTCGSGSALRAARSLGCNNVLGLERNEEFAAAARRAWSAK